MNPETRRSGGMHYTSIENIHKVIDPLFLDDLKMNWKRSGKYPSSAQKRKTERISEKLAGLRWLDPASGSGNFLTETYISIRRLENVVIKELQGGQITFGFDGSSPIQVSIDQFYGIEINDFAVTVAKTALWIAESQMMKETEDIVHMNLDFLPLTTNAFIVEGNALQLDWEDVVPKNQLSYIMGNPPFIGYSLQSKEQKMIFCLFIWMKKESHIRLPVKLIMLQDGILKHQNLCREQQYELHLYLPILLHKENRLLAFGSLYMKDLVFTLTLPIGRFVGIVRRA